MTISKKIIYIFLITTVALGGCAKKPLFDGAKKYSYVQKEIEEINSEYYYLTKSAEEPTRYKLSSSILDYTYKKLEDPRRRELVKSIGTEVILHNFRSDIVIDSQDKNINPKEKTWLNGTMNRLEKHYDATLLDLTDLLEAPILVAKNEAYYLIQNKGDYRHVYVESPSRGFYLKYDIHSVRGLERITYIESKTQIITSDVKLKYVKEDGLFHLDEIKIERLEDDRGKRHIKYKIEYDNKKGLSELKKVTILEGSGYTYQQFKYPDMGPIEITFEKVS